MNNKKVTQQKKELNIARNWRKSWHGAVYCPKCDNTMMQNGFTNGKQRWRCKCGYNETDNSTAHNRNKR